MIYYDKQGHEYLRASSAIKVYDPRAKRTYIMQHLNAEEAINAMDCLVALYGLTTQKPVLADGQTKTSTDSIPEDGGICQ